MAEKLGEPPQVLRGSCKQHFVPDAAQAPQPKPVEPENPFHVRPTTSEQQLFRWIGRAKFQIRQARCWWEEVRYRWGTGSVPLPN
jgi:hypothetical protein